MSNLHLASDSTPMTQTLTPHQDIHICNAEHIAALREKLAELSESAPGLFAQQVREFMLAAGVPAQAPGAKGTFTVSSFINGEPLYAVNETTIPEYEEIHDRARKSARMWNKLPLAARQEFFRILAEEVGPKYRAAIDLAITVEVGKAGSEFEKTTRWDEWAASPQVGSYISGTYVLDEKGRKYYLEQAESLDDTAKHYYFYQDAPAQGVGIVGSTNGFNYPAALAIPDIVASRLCGNSFIGKVPSKSPSFLYIRRRAEEEALDLMASRLRTYPWAEQTSRQGADFGDRHTLATLKEGFGIISGRHIIEQWAQDCATLRVVGGRAAGLAFSEYRRAVDPTMERTILELAGNNPVVLMPSAANLPGGLKKVISGIAEGNKNNSGQRCTSPRRWFVHQEIYAEVKKLAIAEYEASAANGNGAIDNPLKPGAKVGAMDKGGFEAAQNYLRKAEALGATVIGGARIYESRFPKAYYMTPALVIWETVNEEKKTLMHEQEIFAPIANLDQVSSLGDAIYKTNCSREHLSGGFYCDDAHIGELYTFIRSTNLGSLIHNSPPKDLSPDGIHAGRDEGGIGVTGGLQGLDQYLKRPPANNIRLLGKVDGALAARALAEKLIQLR